MSGLARLLQSAARATNISCERLPAAVVRWPVGSLRGVSQCPTFAEPFCADRDEAATGLRGSLPGTEIRRSMMKRLLALLLSLVLMSAKLGTSPSIYPTGTTIYDPARAWSGYTVFDTPN